MQNTTPGNMQIARKRERGNEKSVKKKKKHDGAFGNIVGRGGGWREGGKEGEMKEGSNYIFTKWGRDCGRIKMEGRWEGGRRQGRRDQEKGKKVLIKKGE